MLTWLARVAPGTASSLLRSPGSAGGGSDVLAVCVDGGRTARVEVKDRADLVGGVRGKCLPRVDGLAGRGPRPGDVEICCARREPMDLEGEVGYHAEIAAAAAPQGPEQIGIALFVDRHAADRRRSRCWRRPGCRRSARTPFRPGRSRHRVSRRRCRPMGTTRTGVSLQPGIGLWRRRSTASPRRPLPFRPACRHGWCSARAGSARLRPRASSNRRSCGHPSERARAGSLPR